MDAAQDVAFDFDGSLELARSLWRLADDVGTLLSSRAASATTALTNWAGRYADDFVDRAETEQSTGTTLAQMLRADASGWAQAWAAAMDEQNRILHARESKRIEDDRGLLDQIGGFFTGHDDLPSMPEPASVPQPPSFFPTRSFVRYSS